MGTEQSKALDVITEFLTRANKSVEGLSEETGLWAGGLELDSLEAAELSVMLEDTFGSDPFSAGGAMPEKVGDVTGFYANA